MSQLNVSNTFSKEELRKHLKQLMAEKLEIERKLIELEQVIQQVQIQFTVAQ
jgi:hypothetical protein